MALWMPYADNVPLDLSVKSKNKQCCTEVPQSVRYPYIYRPMSVPLAETSPLSGCSASRSTKRDGVSPAESPDFNIFEDLDNLSDNEEFQEFERETLRVMAEKNGGSLLGNNPKMRRSVQTNQSADDAYRKQRERNNLAAKQSRDRRKLREIHLSLKVQYLKRKFSKLKEMLVSNTCILCRR